MFCCRQAMNVKYEDTTRRAIEKRAKMNAGKKNSANYEVPIHLQVYEQIVRSNKHLTLNPMAAPYDSLIEKFKEETQEEKPEKYRKQPYTGEKWLKEYTMPPWPPNITNLEAFKNLLLNRRMLIARAGGLYVEAGAVERDSIMRDETDGYNDSSEEEMVNTVVDSDHVVPVTSSESYHPHPVAIVSQNSRGGTDGPIVVTNQMDKPANVIIRTEGSKICPKDTEEYQTTHVTENKEDTEEYQRTQVTENKSDTPDQIPQNISTNLNGVEPGSAGRATSVADNVAVVTLTDGTEISVAVMAEDNTSNVTMGNVHDSRPDTPVVVQPQPRQSLGDEAEKQEATTVVNTSIYFLRIHCAFIWQHYIKFRYSKTQQIKVIYLFRLKWKQVTSTLRVLFHKAIKHLVAIYLRNTW